MAVRMTLFFSGKFGRGPRPWALAALAVCSALMPHITQAALGQGFTPLPSVYSNGNNNAVIASSPASASTSTPSANALQAPRASNPSNTSSTASPTLQVSTLPNNTVVRSQTLDTGTVVSEYATSAGVVFAVTWQGPTLPDLQSLLGSYFGTFQSEMLATRARRNIGTPVAVQSEGLVVASHGRMRNFSGFAYAPRLVPENLRISDVLP